MKGYYNILDALKNHLESNPNINTVHEGGFDKVDLSKETIFPLSNIDIQSVEFASRSLRFNVTILVADILDETKENEKDENNVFHGANNLQDIYNTQLSVLNVLQSYLRRGELMDEDYELLEDETPSARAFEQRFDNLLAGWVLNVKIEVPNTDVSVC